jgi:two-component system nitrate/nitrite response regulator NarL
MSSDPITPTYILHSDDLFREGLRLLLCGTRFRPQGCAIEPDDLVEVRSDRIALFIVGVNQAVICNKIRNRYPFALIVAIADEGNSRALATALENGANAALFSSVSPGALVNALQALIDGKLSLIDARLWPREIQPGTREIVSPILHDRTSPPLQNDVSWEVTGEMFRPKQLSSRELEILERIVQGESNKHIARFFDITEPTVKAHVKSIFRKIGANNRTQAAMWARNRKPFDDVETKLREPPLLQRH